MIGISFVIPVRNAGPLLAETLASIDAQQDGRPVEIVIVDDHLDGEAAIDIPRTVARCPVRVVRGDGRGAAAAINAGIRTATHPLICQVDQDVVLTAGWMQALTAAMADPDVAAAQGCYVSSRLEPFLSRVTGLDLQLRYSAIDGSTDHVCTGNTMYRADALESVGLLDESLGYGYDNDLSYRLRAAGYTLLICKDARSRHRWRHQLSGYLRQQYGFGYGRVDLVARHPARCTGDAVSPIAMMAHPLVMAAALVSLIAAAVQASAGTSWQPALSLGVLLIGGLALERARAGFRAWLRFRDLTALTFPVIHLLRDAAWVVAIIVWSCRRVLRQPGLPGHSMRARAGLR
jgi:hypothetical protein